jgi:ubiquinone/menaquinone biosynthesis C-methylase UbiE
MQSEHSVSSHLHLDTTQYDRIIRTYIPHYDESRGVQLDLLSAALIPGASQIVDLGGGTGSLAEAILERFSQCSVRVRDIDREMLSLAQARLSRFGNRFESEVGSFDDPLPRVDAVLAAFALHHIRNLNEKRQAYRRIREAVRAGGVFLNADAVSVVRSGDRYEMSGLPSWRARALRWSRPIKTSTVGLRKICISPLTKSYVPCHKPVLSTPSVFGGVVRSPFSGHDFDCNLASDRARLPRSS